MKSMGKNPRGELWEIMIDVNVDGNLGIYIMAQNTSQDSAWDDTNRNIQCVRRERKLEDLQPPSLLQMELQNIDRFSESRRPQVHQEVLTVRDQLERSRIVELRCEETEPEIHDEEQDRQTYK
ncbi:hypothetical protein IGI04_005961 [Brassica rapa subsp. trilocularis]|uniref:Uncharacterized protein n=1 Tax=Brassica rapa subsp. trilocularis TaxID=1813537 RepID=A0ABQ7NFH8_BRACM|nr:hypothetical protein IGI04_005961 [Brassica rapa subsp. trilocularis]